MIKPAWWCLSGVLLALCGTLALMESLATRAAHPSAGGATDAAQPYDATLSWVRLQGAGRTLILYVGGSFACQIEAHSFTGGECSDWALRSTDGGRSWTDLRPALGVPLHRQPGDWPDSFLLSPFIVAADSRHLYTTLTIYDPIGYVHMAGSVYAASSTDLGHHWTRSIPESRFGYLSRLFLYAVPRAPLRLYAVTVCDNCTSPDLTASSDGGRSWKTATNPLLVAPVPGEIGIVGDPVHAATIYANITDYPSEAQAGHPLHAYAAIRSTDDGRTWTLLSPPAARPPLQTFSVSTDAHVGTQLVGRTQDRSVPADRRYLSRDEGHTWRVATCPGDVRGHCPTFTVDNVFGAGASYGFVPASPDGRVRSGVYRFHGAGPGADRLALSARLPVRIEDLLDVQAGPTAGEAIYLLSSEVRGTMHGALWRSADGGKTWQRLLGSVQLSPYAALRAPARP